MEIYNTPIQNQTRNNNSQQLNINNQPDKNRKAELLQHVTIPPSKKKNEIWSDYVDRVHQWIDDLMESRMASGVFRQMEAVPFEQLGHTLISVCFILSMISYAVGLKYYPIALSRRFMAALIGYRGNRAEEQGQKAIDTLVKVGVLELVQQGTGNKASYYIVTFNNNKEPKDHNKSPVGSNNTKDHNKSPVGSNNTKKPAPSNTVKTKILKETATAEPQTNSSRPELLHLSENSTTVAVNVESKSGKSAQTEPTEPPKAELELIKQVRIRFNNRIPVTKIQSLIATTSLENVQNQLKWFPNRDTSSFTRGKEVAFCTFCRDEVGEPEVVAARRQAIKQAEAERLARQKEAEKKAEEQCRKADNTAKFKQLLAKLSHEELSRIKSNIIKKLGKFFTSENSPGFQSLLQKEVLAMA